MSESRLRHRPAATGHEARGTGAYVTELKLPAAGETGKLSTSTPLGTVKTRVRLGLMKLKDRIRPYIQGGTHGS